ncbi:hypothetical protein [Haloferula sp.]|uniref:hypothetical protein n=1 Tax=Haloferula sp. TaxID=2497595 RepID=UPI00329BD607
MAIFLHEPRYLFGCLGFFTEPQWGRRILVAGAIISAVGFLSAIASGLFGVPEANGSESIFLIASAWLLVFGLMRLFCTGAMWIFSIVFDWISEGIPSLSSATYFARRAYWIFMEVFLSTAFLGTLLASILVAAGVLSMAEDKQAEQGVAPNRSSAPLLNSTSTVRGSVD